MSKRVPSGPSGPSRRKTGSTLQIAVRLPIELHGRVCGSADARGVPLSRVVVDALEAALGRSAQPDTGRVTCGTCP